MVNGLNATTPQLKFMERLIEAYTTRDINNVGPFLSKNYKNQSFPKVAHLPDHTKGEHVQLFGPLLMAMTKIEYFCHEVIDAPGKLVLHWTAVATRPDGVTAEYESLTILTLVEEDGEIKVLEHKEFTDPEKRGNFHKALAKGE